MININWGKKRKKKHKEEKYNEGDLDEFEGILIHESGRFG